MRLAVILSLALLTVSLVFQLLAMVSIPISSIVLSQSPGYEYGVFGYCSQQHHKCSSKQIGYSSEYAPHPVPPNKVPTLPSGLKFSVTKLLVVHPLSFAITMALYVMVFLIEHKQLANSSSFLLSVALFSLPSFLISLLSFLVDVLIFSAHLRWPGWLLLPATIQIAVCCSLLWTLRRTVSIKNYEAFQSSRTNTIETYSMRDWRDRARISSISCDDDRGKPLLEPEFTYTTEIE